ncbi:hypothetical protein Y695_04894 [Hydrogenophaga sp. T4]|nr:hypothetical protein Y695_04894 [Hydrogenophaga sp. T4]
MAGALHVGLRQRQGAGGGNAQLQLDQIEAGDFFGHRVFDLQARIDFQEIMFLARDDKLHRAQAAVVHARSQLDRVGQDGRA